MNLDRRDREKTHTCTVDEEQTKTKKQKSKMWTQKRLTIVEEDRMDTGQKNGHITDTE